MHKIKKTILNYIFKRIDVKAKISINLDLGLLLMCKN